MASAFRETLKRVLPSRSLATLGRMRTYFRRLSILRDIQRHVKGVAPEDTGTLRNSLSAALRGASSSLDEWQDPVLVRDAALEVQGIGRFKVRSHSDDLWHILPTREPAVFSAISSILQPGDNFVDAGANIGFYSVVASAIVGPTGSVTAIEMMPDTATRLRTHIQINGLKNVEVVERALSDRTGETASAHVLDGKYGQATIAADSTLGRLVRVETVTLDDALSGLGDIRLMKMDLEGMEARALQGAELVLHRVQAIVFESAVDDETVALFLRGKGYDVQRLDGRNRLATRLASGGR